MPHPLRAVLAASVTTLALAACESATPLSPDVAQVADLVRFDVVQGAANIYDDLGGTDPVVDGAKLIAAGVALDISDAGTITETISLTVPAGATVESALLYWGSRRDLAALDEDDGELSVTVGATTATVEGDYVGATTLNLFPTDADSHSFRADLIAEGFSFGPGLNEVELEVDAAQEVDGATLIITYDDGSSGSVVIRDGNDFAYEPRGMQTNEQTFTFPSAPVDRTATLLLVVGDVEDRPTRIVIESGGTGDQVLDNQLGDGGPGRNGHQWDTYPISVQVPAGSTELSAQLLSFDDATAEEPSSLYWVVGALELPVPPPPPPPLCDGLTPGYWKNWSNHYTTAQFQTLVDAVNAHTGGSLTIAQITGFLAYEGSNAVDKLRKFYYANLLTLALTANPSLPNPDTAGLGMSCTSSSYDDTLGEALDAAEAILANPGGYTKNQINAVKDVLDAIANLNN